MDSPNFLGDTRVKVNLVSRPSSSQLRKSWASANMAYSRAESMFTPKYYVATKSFGAVREAFIDEYPDRKVPSNARTYRLVTTFRNMGNVCMYHTVTER